ncbi:MAG: 3'(2'),5'-bisphosphate nucleotidase CysQ [Hydrogenophilaceae bacterium]|jgi:3'(2'), 5'-bisphosphate nucleotidase|nr:3'(2'),5'-bisphosphate nucleotidase CysQ [Hydrogenophilaceae bacterium]
MSAHTRPSLEALIALARDAGREIMAVRDAGAAAHRKDDGSPVTEADQRAEALILAGLARLAPGAPVLAEEAYAAGHRPDLSAGPHFFCVDALDGTKDFLAEGDGGSFTVNIAWIEAGRPVVGVVYAPALGDLFAGAEGQGALRGAFDARTGAERAALSPIRVANRAAPPWRIAASRRHGDADTAAFIKALGQTKEVRVSSSIKFCLTAAGEIDVYPRFGTISEWDAAAGHAVLAAAGGVMNRLTGEPVAYGRAARDFLIDGFVATGGAAAEAETRRILAAMR